MGLIDWRSETRVTGTDKKYEINVNAATLHSVTAFLFFYQFILYPLKLMFGDILFTHQLHLSSIGTYRQFFL